MAKSNFSSNNANNYAGETLESKVKKINILGEYLINNKLVHTSGQWAERIGIKASTLSRNKNDETARIKEVESIIENTCDNFRITITLSESTYIVEALEALSEEQENIFRYCGLYRAFFLRSTDNEISEMILMITPDCKIKYKSFRTKSTEGVLNEKFYDEFKILLLEFNHKDVHINFIIKANFHIYDKSQYLEGLYSGFSKLSGYMPLGGLIRLKKLIDWSENEQAIREQYHKETPKNYLIPDQKQFNEILTKEPSLLSFFLGNTNGQFHIETVSFFQKVKLVPHFEYSARDLAGVYRVYRLRTDKSSLVSRALEIFEDGRVCMKLTRSNNHHLYWGRIHLFGRCIAISIDRMEHNKPQARGAEEDIHRTHYLFHSNAYDDRTVFQHLFGMSCIVNNKWHIRVGDEFLDKVDESFDKIDSFIKEEKDLDSKEREIFNYLRRGVVGRAIRQPDAPIHRNDNLGFAYFGSACYLAQKGEDDKAIANLKRSILHGFTDDRLFIKEIVDKQGALHHLRNLIFEEIDRYNWRLKSTGDLDKLLHDDA